MLLRIKVLLVAVLLTGPLLLATTAHARTSHGFAFDAMRALDETLDGGQPNLSWQVSTGRRSALVLSGAAGDDYQVYEAGFKRYNERYLSGTFFQLGASYWKGDSGIDSELGLDLRLGYELPLTTWAVLTGAVSTVYGTDLTDNDLLFRPHLGIMIHF